MMFGLRAERGNASLNAGTRRREGRASLRGVFLTVVTGAALAAVALAVAPVWASSVPAGASNEVAVYVDGQTYRMVINHVNLNPSSGEIAAARPFYVAVFPVNPDGRTDLGSVTLPSGYRPQCDPCFHPGLAFQLVYHDHILAGAPGFGIDGTAQEQQGTRQPIAVMYDPTFVQRPDFRPLTTVDEVRTAEGLGQLLPINAGAANPFELPQPVVVTVQLVPPSR
jgi:hypothetical protein